MVSLEAVIHPERVSNLADVFYRKGFFTQEMTNRLESMLKEHNYKFQKGRTGSAELGKMDDKYSNNRDIAYITPKDHSKWLYDILSPLAMEANKIFNFDIDIVTDPIHYVIYPEDGGHLDWHMDIGYGAVCRRKLAMTVQLSDPSEYDGGAFEVWMGGKDKFVEVPRERGDVLAFPSYLMHRVKPITRGQRKCIVFWTGATKPFR